MVNNNVKMTALSIQYMLFFIFVHCCNVSVTVTLHKLESRLLLTNLLATPIKSHPPMEHEPPCIYEKENGRLTCKEYFENFNGTTFTNVTELRLYNMIGYWNNVNFRVFEKVFPNLESLSVLEGNDRKLKKDRGVTVEGPESFMELKHLKIVGLGLINLDDDFFDKFPFLEELDLRDNNLTRININPLINLNAVYLSGNKWNCSEDLDWILKPNVSMIIKDIKNMTCYKTPYPGKPLQKIAKFLLDVKTNCTEKCECHLLKVVQNPSSDKFEPIVKVNCTNRGFTELPTKFPKATKILHLEGNRITELKPLKTNILYRNLLDLYVDNNDIRSIRALEGSYWLTHFRVFSLVGNKLTELPSYALDNALQQNTNMPNAVSIALGGNPWRCDCAFTPVFQEMLRKYANQIKDLKDIKCSYVEGDENSLLPILDLSRSSVCRLPSEYSVQEALDLLNGILGFLIIFVLGKLAYDYYYFKKTGRLPWIVTKIP